MPMTLKAQIIDSSEACCDFAYNNTEGCPLTKWLILGPGLAPLYCQIIGKSVCALNVFENEAFGWCCVCVLGRGGVLTMFPNSTV